MAAAKEQNPDSENQTAPGWGVFDLVCLGLFFAVLMWAMLSRDYVLAIAWCLISLCGCSGLRSGATGMVGMLVAMGLAIAYGPTLGVRFEGEVSHWIGMTGVANRLLSISIHILMITLLGAQLIQWVVYFITYKKPLLLGLNRYVGGVLGCIQGVAAVFLLVGGLFMIESMQQRDSASTSVSFETTSPSLLQRLIRETRSSRLGDWVVRYNPYEKIPQLNRFNEVKRTVEMLAQPARVQELLAHPEVTRLKSDPQVQQAIRELRDDPGISQVLQGGKPLDSAAVMMLMNHPKVLNLLDQPGFLESARRAAELTGNGQAATD
jgi:hypothetical protein